MPSRIAFDSLTAHQGDTSRTPYAFGTEGSRSGPILGAAVQRAAELMKSRVVGIAAHLMEAPEDLDVKDGVVSVRDSPSRRRALAEEAAAAYCPPDELPPGMGAGMTAGNPLTATFLGRLIPNAAGAGGYRWHLDPGRYGYGPPGSFRPGIIKGLI